MNDIAVLLFFSICIHGHQEDKSTFVNNFLNYFLHGYEQFNHLDSEMIKHLPKFLKLREYDLFLALYSLPLNEYYEYEKHFMNNRKQSIEMDLPFIDIE
jgi:Ser/Thr protein kinase RdoA (MazF antagonist)